MYAYGLGRYLRMKLIYAYSVPRPRYVHHAHKRQNVHSLVNYRHIFNREFDLERDK
jgi:hypothetical protein